MFMSNVSRFWPDRKRGLVLPLVLWGATFTADCQNLSLSPTKKSQTSSGEEVSSAEVGARGWEGSRWELELLLRPFLARGLFR